MKVEGRWRHAIEIAEDYASVRVLDQTRLPYAIEWLHLTTLDDVARAIRDMHVRGAPLIGVTAAFGVGISLVQDPASLDHACEVLAATRPTAVNLKWALDEMRRAIVRNDLVGPVLGTDDPDDKKRYMIPALLILRDEVERCVAIAEHGVPLIRTIAERVQRPVNVLTHCNAGWLATVDWGTALAPIYKAHEAGIAVHVWVDETRPRNQGLLTAWELAQHGVPHTLIADNAGGHLMQDGQVDLCIVGTDRTTRTGDVANKIGTYLKALAAHDNGVPFYVAAPSPSIDWTLADGRAIPIEERSRDEVCFVAGRDEQGRPARVCISDSAIANPAFDVTPRKYITGIITERGVAEPARLVELFPERKR